MGVASTPEHIIRDPNLSVGAKAVWGVLASFSDGFYGEQHVWPSQLTIAKHLDVTDRCVRKWITELESAGVLHVVRQNTHAGRESNVYVLHFSQEERPQEPRRNSGSTGVPMEEAKAVTPQDAHGKPAGTPQEPRRNAGSSKGLEGSEGLDLFEGSFTPAKPGRTRSPRPRSDTAIAFDTVWALWEKHMIPAQQIREKTDGHKRTSVLNALSKYGLETLEQTMIYYAREYRLRPPSKHWSIEAWCAEANIKSFVHKATVVNSPVPTQTPELTFDQWKEQQQQKAAKEQDNG